MAEVKMDISEYEALKKVEFLLQESKEEQEKLYKQLDTIQKEKITLLSETANQVLYKKTIDIRHYRLGNVNPDLFYSFMNNWERYYRYGRGNISTRSCEESLMKAFFDILESLDTAVSTSEKEEEVTYKGLQEVRKEISEKLQASLDKKAKEAIAFQKENEKTVKLYKEAISVTIPSLLDSIDELKKDSEEKELLLKESISKVSYTNYLINEISLVLAKSTFFNRKSSLKKIYKLILNK